MKLDPALRSSMTIFEAEPQSHLIILSLTTSNTLSQCTQSGLSRLFQSLFVLCWDFRRHHVFSKLQSDSFDHMGDQTLPMYQALMPVSQRHTAVVPLIELHECLRQQKSVHESRLKQKHPLWRLLCFWKMSCIFSVHRDSCSHTGGHPFVPEISCSASL